MARRGLPRAPGAVPLGVAVVLVVVLFSAPPASAGFPVLPLRDDAGFLTGLSAPPMLPGSSEVVAFALGDPMGAPLEGVVLTLELYAFDAYPGNASGPLPSSGGPVLSNSSSSSLSVTWSVGGIAPGASAAPTAAETITVTVPGSAPPGTYAIRASLDFRSNGTAYRLESRGFFSSSAWENATGAPNGTYTHPGLNVSALGVSGVLPETAVLVRPPPADVPLYLLLGASVALAGLGGYVAWRRGPGSRSGARPPEPPSSAESAFGKSRTSDGD